MKNSKILIINATFTISGVPLAQLRLANALSNRGHEIYYVICGKNKDNLLNEKNYSDLKIIFLNRNRVALSIIDIAKLLIKIKPDVIFVSEDHLGLIVIIAALLSGYKGKISVSSRVPPDDTDSFSSIVLSKGWFLKILYKILIRRANVLTCVSKDMAEIYNNKFKTKRYSNVYNIINCQENYNKMKDSIFHPWFNNDDNILLISACNLHIRKGVYDLVKAFNIAIKENEKLKLIILGDGPEKNNLNKFLVDNNLTDKVYLAGNVDNPIGYFINAKIFILASYGEGMPNALIEAIFSNCIPIATRCITGPEEIIIDGVNGFLVEVGDFVGLSDAILKAIDFNTNFDNSIILEEFSVDFVLKKHSNLLGIEL